jgi:anti-sigma-K factor RskA
MSGVDDNDDDLRAAEYVIGTLDADERAAYAARMHRDEGARRAVAAWERRLADLALAVEPVRPPDRVWEGIERGIAPSARMHSFRVIDGGQSARTGDAMKRSRDRWRTAALAAGMVAAALLVLSIQHTLKPEEPDADYVAAVNRGGDKPALIVRVNLKTGRVFIRPVYAEAPTGHSLELWYIGSDKTPRSMGILTADTRQAVLPSDPAAASATFAVSVEPVGGSKTGGPTGPVVYTGQLVKD